MNRHAASAQIESEDVDAVSVFITGDKDNSARNANIDDFTVFASTEKERRRKRPVGHTGCMVRGDHKTHGLWASAPGGTCVPVGSQRLAKQDTLERKRILMPTREDVGPALVP